MAISIQERVERTLERHGYEAEDASGDGESGIVLTRKQGA